ncbi:ROK family protein [Gynurincola endophyticus]|uniref:ROK family protein n=1 Tax=Gynurincola endophyticus TaxID=2479004 RepID=UPI000F8E7CF7|nr:ROK family protein [Gynurincola endophyticus]
MSTLKRKEYAIGIDIGGTNTVFGLVDHRGAISYRGAVSTKKHEKIEDYIQDLYIALQPAIEQAGGIHNVEGIGVGAPNGNYYSGTIEYAPNLTWKGIIPIAELLSEKFGVPCSLTNDANAAAVGEMMYGVARGMKDFLMITLGTGVGSGIVANGQLILGHDGFAGELGHVTIIPDGRLHPGTGLRGSLEAYASATGVAATAKEFLETRPEIETKMSAYAKEDINSKVVYDCAVAGDLLAKEVYEFTGKVLGLALANFVMATSPSAIVFFGGMTKAGDFILKPTQKHMEDNLLPIFRNKVKLLFSELDEADAAILGASALVWESKL